MSVKQKIDHIFGYFYSAYIQRWHEQGLSGKVDLTISFFKGGVANANFYDKETKKPAELEESPKFSDL